MCEIVKIDYSFFLISSSWFNPDNTNPRFRHKKEIKFPSYLNKPKFEIRHCIVEVFVLS